MNLLDQMLKEARALYESTAGAPFGGRRTGGRKLSPPGDESLESFLFREIAHLRNLMAARESPFWSATPQWMPPIDMMKLDGDLVIRVELAGVGRSEAQVSAAPGFVVVKGERRPERGSPECRVVARERFYGPFERWIPLPPSVVPEQVDATLEEGVLEIRLPAVPPNSRS